MIEVFFQQKFIFLILFLQKVDYFEVFIIFTISISLSVLSTIYPSWKASKIEPANVLRYGEILSLKNISQFFYQGKNKINVLTNLDLVISSSQNVAIIGSSGSGKTSLLNIISLMEKPKSGSIFLLGNSITDANDNNKSDLRKTNIGYVHQKKSFDGVYGL